MLASCSGCVGAPVSMLIGRLACLDPPVGNYACWQTPVGRRGSKPVAREASSRALAPASAMLTCGSQIPLKQQCRQRAGEARVEGTAGRNALVFLDLCR